jgi:hypothetical protein
MTEAAKLDCLVAELVDECLLTGLSIHDAEARLLDKAVRDLHVNNPDLYRMAYQDATARGGTVLDVVIAALGEERTTVKERAQHELHQLRGD